jgi:hypothetical protein
MDWFAAERPVLLAMAPLAAEIGFLTHAWQLAWTMVDFLDRRGFWDEWVTVELLASTPPLSHPRTGNRVRG